MVAPLFSKHPRSQRAEGLMLASARGSMVETEKHPVAKPWEQERNTLLSSSITLRLPNAPGVAEHNFQIPIQDHPEWIMLQRGEETHAAIDVESVAAFLETFLKEKIAPLLPAPSNARLLALPQEGEVHATIEGRARDGFLIRENAAQVVAHALAQGQLTVTLSLDYVQGIVRNETGMDLGPFVLLARGRSNFAGSVPNRAQNVHKAFAEHVNNVLVPREGIFSFQALFPKGIGSANGWKMAMGIFDGGRLEATAGGGICQSSTTLYRAALLAGMPILEHHSHSMYIKFYRENGEGLDATFYPGSKDLKFLNDTGNPLLIQAYDEGEEAIVEIYGTPDGRSVILEGPYRASDAPAEITHPNGRPLGSREIGWSYQVRKSDGAIEERILISHYVNDIPAEPPGDSL